MKHKCLQHFLAILIYSVSSLANAELIVSTLPEVETNEVGIGWNDYAAGFIWNSNEKFSYAELYLSTVGDPANLNVSIFDNSTNSPGNLVTVLSGNSDPSAAGIYQFFGSASLDFGNTYWLVATNGVNNDSNNQYIWWDGTMGDTNYVDSVWRRNDFNNGDWQTSGIVSPAAFAVHSQIPEPTSFAIFAMGIIGLAMRGFKNKIK